MCELFGMSARSPTDVDRSLSLLRPRGGEIGPHADGWGVAFYEGRAARVFKEPIPAAESRCLAFIGDYGFRAHTVVGHIRRANPAAFGRSAANTHPFERELGGRSWVFAHNGKLEGLDEVVAPAPRRFHPIGETDSERAFCLLLDVVAARCEETAPSAEEIATAIAPVVETLAGLGEFNFLLSDGAHLFAHAHTRLSAVERACDEAGCRQKVTLLATAPLTDEAWRPLTGLHVFAAGDEVSGPWSDREHHAPSRGQDRSPRI